MGKDADGGAGELGGVDETGVGEFVEQDEIIFADGGGDDAESGGEAGAEGECRLRLFGFGKGCLELQMRGECAADQARCGRAGAEFFDAFDE